MAHKQKKDPFVPITFLITAAILGATVFVLVSNLFSTIERNSVKGAEDNSRQAAVADESLKPVGNVTTTADAPAVAAPASTGSSDGEAIYKATCFACHSTGVAASPILGNKEHWEPRVATGLDALMTTAMNGRGAMPAKGGNTALSEADVKAAVLYMTKEAGFDLGSSDSAPAKEAPAKEAKAEPVAAPVPEKAEPVVAPAPVKEEPATEEAPAKEEVPATKPEPVAPTKPEPIAEPTKPETPTTPVEPETPATPAVPSAPEAPASSADGKAIYNATCFACHKTAVAGAPLFGDKKLWAPRIATGMDAMVASVINGKGAMPPKGGSTTLSDDEIKAAVAYMVDQAK